MMWLVFDYTVEVMIFSSNSTVPVMDSIALVRVKEYKSLCYCYSCSTLVCPHQSLIMPCNPGNLHTQQSCYRATFINKQAISTPPLPTGFYFRGYAIPRVLQHKLIYLSFHVGLEECSLKTNA